MNSATKNNSSNKNEKGFSLLEVIFAMAIITSGIISILSLFSYNLKAEINNKNKLIATYLAQEGIEVVRQIRDNIWFDSPTPPPPRTFLNKLEFADGDNYIITPNQENNLRKGWNIEVSGNVLYRKVYFYDNINKDYYLQKNDPAPGNWGKTGFSRYLEIENNSDGGSAVSGCDVASCVKITSHVSYNGIELAKITAYLYDNWY